MKRDGCAPGTRGRSATSFCGERGSNAAGPCFSLIFRGLSKTAIINLDIYHLTRLQSRIRHEHLTAAVRTHHHSRSNVHGVGPSVTCSFRHVRAFFLESTPRPNNPRLSKVMCGSSAVNPAEILYGSGAVQQQASITRFLSTSPHCSCTYASNAAATAWLPRSVSRTSGRMERYVGHLRWCEHSVPR